MKKDRAVRPLVFDLLLAFWFVASGAADLIGRECSKSVVPTIGPAMLLIGLLAGAVARRDIEAMIRLALRLPRNATTDMLLHQWHNGED